MNKIKEQFKNDFQDCEDNPEGFLEILKQYPTVELKKLLKIKCKCE
ncbi:MAG: hypothetical protein VB038_04270 [Methanobrevibacter sp.]|nr:hypothetical protein [Methanobrevibacter sp.]MEA4956921.1 hypothetical protein [Methanobrevibacter sp.]